MNMTPQSFPLEAWTPEGERVLVIGWTRTARWATDEHGNATTGARAVPVVVELDRSAAGAVVLADTRLTFLRPSDSTR